MTDLLLPTPAAAAQRPARILGDLLDRLRRRALLLRRCLRQRRFRRSLVLGRHLFDAGERVQRDLDARSNRHRHYDWMLDLGRHI